MRRISVLILVFLIIFLLSSCDVFRELIGDNVNSKEDNGDSENNGESSDNNENNEEEDLPEHTHVFSGATCTEPGACECGENDGLPLGHDMGDATCTEASACVRCGYTEGEKLGHLLECEEKDGALSYFCSSCEAAFCPDTYFYLDGSDYDGMTGVLNEGFATAEGTELPVIKNGEYVLVNNSGEKSQLQLWVPSNGALIKGFSSENRAVGFFSMRISAFVDGGFCVKLVDNSSTGKRWSPEFAIDEDLLLFTTERDRTQLITSISGWGGVVLHTVTSDMAEGFTEFVDIKVGLVLDPGADIIIAHYYVNSKYVTTATKPLTIITDSVNSVYLNGDFTAEGTGIIIDDIAFGFSKQSEWVFDGCEHDLTEPTCTEPSICTICGITESEPLGHTGGEGTCNTPAVCERCGKEYTRYNHEFAAPTCAEPATCINCGYKEGGLLSHTLLSDYSGSSVRYYCPGCDKSISVGGYLSDGTDHTGMSGVLNNEKYTTAPNTHLPVIKDGHYELFNTIGENSQLQLWLPNNTHTEDSLIGNFTSKSYPVGFISFKINAKMLIGFSMKFVDTRAEGARWSADWCITDNFFTIQAPKIVDGETVVTISGWNTELATVTADSDGFTGWLDFIIGIVLDPASDQITLHYYLSGEYIASRSKKLTTSTDAINSIYVTGSTAALGAGVMLDDIAFGYAERTGWAFDNCDHTWVNATCTAAKTCNKCGKTVGSPLGHRGGVATCTELAICTVCKKAYGELTDHVMVGGVCSECGYSEE